jgi:hypothetical protein
LLILNQATIKKLFQSKSKAELENLKSNIEASAEKLKNLDGEYTCNNKDFLYLDDLKK